MSDICYIIEALRWGDDHDHSYVVGLYNDLNAAINVADEHANYRGGKYLCQIIQCRMNGTVDSDMSSSILYQTKCSQVDRRHFYSK